MAAKYPRVICPCCARDIAGSPTKRLGVVSIMDHKVERHALVLCPGSERHVPAPDARFVQEMLEERAEAVQAVQGEVLPLF